MLLYYRSIKILEEIMIKIDYQLKIIMHIKISSLKV